MKDAFSVVRVVYFFAVKDIKCLVYRDEFVIARFQHHCRWGRGGGPGKGVPYS